MILPPVEPAVRSSIKIRCCLICCTEISYHADLAAVTILKAERQRYNCSKKAHHQFTVVVAVSINHMPRKRHCTYVKSHEAKGCYPSATQGLTPKRALYSCSELSQHQRGSKCTTALLFKNTAKKHTAGNANYMRGNFNRFDVENAHS